MRRTIIPTLRYDDAPAAIDFPAGNLWNFRSYEWAALEVEA